MKQKKNTKKLDFKQLQESAYKIINIEKEIQIFFLWF